jgi:hypothetical protein
VTRLDWLLFAAALLASALLLASGAQLGLELR